MSNNISDSSLNKLINKKYGSILSVIQAYKEGKNITEFLREQKGISKNTSEIIEIAYDLQAGSYIKHVENNPIISNAYAKELAEIIEKHITTSDILLDVGTGELTTLSLIIEHLKIIPSQLFAFDISWSRLWKGIFFAKLHMEKYFNKLTPFVADILEIPLLNKSINVSISSHALEPNGGKEEEMLSELFRVTKDTLILFEPCYELNSPEGKQRMETLGYIKNLEDAVRNLGGTLIEKIKIKTIINPLNPTTCFIIKPPVCHEETMVPNPADIFSVPGSNLPLKKLEDSYFSENTGLYYPTLKGIPLLRNNAAILATALCTS